MIRSMRPVIETAVRSRWVLPLVALGITGFFRGAHAGGARWDASEMQSVAAMICYCGLVPVLAVALASTWLRGDDGPWTWALARPVSRRRWLSTTLMVDVATLAACLAVVWLMIGELPSQWLSGWSGPVERMLGYVGLLAAIYASAAFAGARGASAIGATLYVVGVAAFVMVLHGVAALSENVAVETLIAPRWANDPSSSHLWRRLVRALETMPSASTMVAVAGFTVIAIGRAASGLPSRPRYSMLLDLAAIATMLAIAVPWIAVALVTS